MKRMRSSPDGAPARPRARTALAALAALAACALISVAASTVHRHDAFAPTQGPTQCALCHVAQQPSLLAIPGPGPLLLQAPVWTTRPDPARPAPSSQYLPLHRSRAPPA